MWMLLRAFIPSSGLLGWGFLVGGSILALSASAHWLREDAFNDCNTAWELKVSKQNVELLASLAKRNGMILDLETKLFAMRERSEILAADNAKLLEKQREATPQTDDCKRCRVPNARIWLRNSAAAGSSTH